MDRAAKEELVSHYNGIFENAGVIVVTHYSGLSVPDLDELRHQMADVGGTVKVTKTVSSSSLSQEHQTNLSVNFSLARPRLPFQTIRLPPRKSPPTSRKPMII